MVQGVGDGEQPPAQTLEYSWSIRPCDAYKDEYEECTSFKARFHQYFINGANTDCTQWKTDYENCLRYATSEGRDLKAAQAIVDSEKNRRMRRASAHYGNTTWKKREQKPPEGWAKPLPEWMEKRNENTYLQIKRQEMEGIRPVEEEKRSACVLM